MIDAEDVMYPGLILDMFGQPHIQFHPIYVQITGDVIPALWLSVAVHYTTEGCCDAQGWINKSILDWETESGLKRRQQEAARKVLKQKGLIEELRPGLTRPLQIRVCAEKLAQLVQSITLKQWQHVNFDQDNGSE
jgi:hypothetical protein